MIVKVARLELELFTKLFKPGFYRLIIFKKLLISSLIQKIAESFKSIFLMCGSLYPMRMGFWPENKKR